MKKLLAIGVVIVVAIAIFYAFVYEKPGAMEEFGRSVDEGIEKIQHGDESTMEKAGRKTKEAIEDAGKELKDWFCDSHNPWQCGSNENTNGLLRQYLPKGMDLTEVSQAKLYAIARRLNERPRKTLNFETPAQRFNQCVASIGWNRSRKQPYGQESSMQVESDPSSSLLI